MRKDIEQLAGFYSAALAEKGVTPEGVLWPNARDLVTRFNILLSPIDFRQYGPMHRVRLLDLGCGPGFLLDYLAENGVLERVEYTGVDVLDFVLQHARSRWPQYRFELRDVRDNPFAGVAFDYCIVCGTFTCRFENSYLEMVNKVQETLQAVWPTVGIGLGFNVMSKHVDWERDDLFHWPLDDIMTFCKGNLSRHVSLRLDYGLWETSVLVRKEPINRSVEFPATWLPTGEVLTRSEEK